MYATVKTVVPSEVGGSSSSASSSPSSSPSPTPRLGAHRTANDIIERLREAELRDLRRRSHAGSLILADRDPRRVEDFGSEIAALEAEARARDLERKAHQERGLAMQIRERPSYPEYDYMDERNRYYGRRSSHYYDDEAIYPPRRSSRYSDDIVLFDRLRRIGRLGREIFVPPRYRRDSYVEYERSRSPPRDILRVERDRRGRMAFVRSSR